MARNHGRLGLENKLLENKIWPNFLHSTNLVNQHFILLYITSEVNSTMRRCFYHTDLGQNAVFYNFASQIALIQHSGRSKHALPLHNKL